MKIKAISYTILSLLLLVSARTYSQDIPDFTLYNNNMILINPAYAGTTDGISLNTGFRKQWLGISGAPTVLSFSGHGLISAFNVGAGLTAWQFKAGAFSQTSVYGNYSYQLDLGFARLNMGLQTGVVNYNTNYSGADLNGIDDPTFSGDINQTRFNWGGGAFLYGDNFYAGISVPILSSYDAKDEVVVKMDRHFYITGGYIAAINEKVSLKPNVLMKMVPGSPFVWNLGATAYYSETFGIGVLYKSQKTMAFIIDLVVDNSIYFSYAYDLPGGERISIDESGSHAIMLNYTIFNDKENKTFRVF